MPTSTTQSHMLASGETAEITRIDGRGHKYVVNGGSAMPSVTGMLGHVEAGLFGIGSGWATKQIRLAGGDLDAPKRVGDKAVADGNEIHDAIESYIKSGTVNEDNAGFISWLNTVGNHYDWLAGEAFVFPPLSLYGGTLDAISWKPYIPNGPDTILWDWKTKDPISYNKYGGSLKDHAQVASYVFALDAMGSEFQVKKAKIAYIMRDGSGTDVVDVDVDASMALFLTSRKMKLLAETYKHMTKPGLSG